MQCFRRMSSVHFQALMMIKSRYKYYSKQITTRDNGKVQSHNQEESKVNSNSNANSGAHTSDNEKLKIHIFHQP